MTEKPPSFLEVYPSIYRLSLPFVSRGKGPGPVNVYLFTEDPVTLIDTGTTGMVPMLRHALAEVGVAVEDIRQLIITHGHLDHYGGANLLIKNLSVLPIVAAHRDATHLIEGREGIHDRTKFPFLKLMGYPLKYQLAMHVLDQQAQMTFHNCYVSRILNDGDTIQCGSYNADILWTPGHSKGSICIYIKDHDILFSGDTILAHMTPNAIVMLEAGRALPVRKSQAEFYASVERLEALNPGTIFPGHGETITNIKPVTSQYRKRYDIREEKLLASLKSGKRNVYDIAVDVFNLNKRKRKGQAFEVFLAISEVYTHLQVLEEQGIVKMVKRWGRIRVVVL